MAQEDSGVTPILRRTRRMQQLDEKFGEPIESVIRRLIAQGRTVEEAAHEIGIPPGTLGGWIVRFRITRRDLIAKVLEDAS